MGLDDYIAVSPDRLDDADCDFDKQEMSSVIDHGQVAEEQLLNTIPMDKFAPDIGLFPPLQAPLPLRPHRGFPKISDRSSPTISGRELLNLEGRPLPEAQVANNSMPVSSSTSSASVAPTLRRKGKFGPDTRSTPRDNRAQDFSKTLSCGAITNGCQPAEAPVSPSSYEWTQKFQQQISLHTNRPELLNPHMQNLQNVQREHAKQTNEQMSPRELFQHKKAYSEQSSLGSTYNHMVDYSHQVSHTVPRDMNVQIPILTTQASNGYDSSQQQSQAPITSDGAFRQHRQAQSWGNTPAGYGSEYTVSPGQLHSHNWIDGIPEVSGTYFQDLSYPTSNPQESPPLYSQEEMAATANTNCYAPVLPLNDQAPFPSLPVDEVLLNNLTSSRRPHTPPPSNPSASPPTPKVTSSPPKQARSSRRQNAGILRNRKTTATLKPAKSHSALKSTKSTGHLRGKRSIGQGLGLGLNHQGGSNNNKPPTKKENSGNSSSQHQQQQQQAMNFGFMNFTPDDSQKILTGVAPSGSSKTKARRELEASEERRRLSLAALKAIEVAGGDTEALKLQFKVDVDGNGDGAGDVDVDVDVDGEVDANFNAGGLLA